MKLEEIDAVAMSFERLIERLKDGKFYFVQFVEDRPMKVDPDGHPARDLSKDWTIEINIKVKETPDE